MSSTSPHTKENVDYATRERKTSQERKVRKVSADNQKQRASLERKQQAPVQEKIEVVKTQKRNPSLEEKQPAIVQERVHVQERRASLEKKQQVVQERIIANSAAQTNAASKDDNTDLQDSIDRRTSLESSGEKHILAELIDMIHDEFAFDGYLDDGVEDVNMESTVSDISRPGSVISTDSHQDLDSSFNFKSISRTSSERSFVETRDYVMSSLGEPSQFLPFRIIAPEIMRDVIDELGPVFEDYYKVMDTFARVHSIHFLNSRTLGVGVGRSSPTKETSQQDNMLGFNAGRRRSLSGALSLNDPQPKMLDENNLFEVHLLPRSIARLVDQIRLFKQMRYAFEANDELAYRLRARILECREENLHALAAENSTNFHLSSSQSSRKFQEAFKKMKATFGNG
ncbi:hypothetical protein QZH41_004499 [Actinostola sp. cb2023]|nr:hypothetical protein QZH41_004499 [Actinostola sp. cb2023]